MEHKRVFVDKKTDYCDVFYYCPFCGSEIIGDSASSFDNSFFMKRDKPPEYPGSSLKMISLRTHKNNLTCPVCGEPINVRDNGCFLNVSLDEKIWEAIRTKKGDGDWFSIINDRMSIRYEFVNYCDFYFNEANHEIEFLRWEDVSARPKEEQEKMKSLYAFEPTDNEQISYVFSCLQKIRAKNEEEKITTTVEDTLAEYEAHPISAPEVDVAVIKSNPEKLKQYIKHLINLESSIYSVKNRLGELLKSKVPVDEEAHVSAYLSAEKLRDELKAAKEAYNNRPNAKTFAANKPKEPTEPIRPEPKKAGLFNKRRIQEENDAAERGYERRHAEYLVALEKYKTALSTFEKETNQKIQEAEKAAAERVTKAQEALNAAVANPPHTVEGEAQIMLMDEVSRAKETLQNLVEAKNAYYSLDVIFGKYRNIVALTSFYEYLVSGRCDTLEGKDGAYNIFESEIRSNQIIAQLNDVMGSLEQIKNGQYLVYSTIKGVYSSLEQLNAKTEAALDSITKMQGDVEQIAKQSEVIAYNTEQAAFYAKKNKELTDALGFMVALK